MINKAKNSLHCDWQDNDSDDDNNDDTGRARRILFLKYQPLHTGRSRDPEAWAALLGLRSECPTEQTENGNEVKDVHYRLVKDMEDTWHNIE